MTTNGTVLRDLDLQEIRIVEEPVNPDARILCMEG